MVPFKVLSIIQNSQRRQVGWLAYNVLEGTGKETVMAYFEKLLCYLLETMGSTTKTQKKI
jgi:hypothetical protein